MMSASGDFGGCFFLASEAYGQDLNWRNFVVDLPVLLEHVQTCVDCRIIRRAIEDFAPHLLEEGRYETHTLCMGVGSNGDGLPNAILSIMLFDKQMDNCWTTFELVRRSTAEPFFDNPYHYIEESSTRISRFGQSLDIVEDSSSQAAFDRAAKWLAHCVENDKACEPPDKDFMPTHLINVGSDSQSPFLFKTSGARKPYACLSYCWGPDSHAILKTTTTNIKEHYQRIPESEIPRGIQEAIRVCRGLQIPFLWVDSLCLVQDDVTAWLDGAAQMSQIYLNSHLTIAALEPDTCKSPFLGPQRFGDRNWQRLVKSPAADGEADPGPDLFIRPTPYEAPRDTPHSLDKRAWCLQESMLPNRRLCFNGDEMMWECLCRQICECGHIHCESRPLSHVETGAALKPNLLERTDTYAMRSYGPKMRSFWRDLVTLYSHRQMTRGDDKLRAIAGLAKLLAEIFRHEGFAKGNDEYLAGLWKYEIHLDLAWVIASLPTEPEKTLPRPEGEDPRWNVPTWSWASSPGTIRYDSDIALVHWKYKPHATDVCHLVEARCERENPHDEMSAVTQGRLTLQGALVPVELIAEVESAPMLFWRSLVDEIDTTEPNCGDRVAWVRSRNQNVNKVLLDHTRHRVELQGLVSEKSPAWAGGEYCCFRLFSWVANTGKVQGRKRLFMGPETWFLVLKRSERVTGAMERIGIGSQDSRNLEQCRLFEESEEATISIV